MPSSYLLTNMPEDVFKFVADEQNKIKKQKRIRQFSFESTIYKMLRDYKRCMEENKNFKPSNE